MKKIIRVLIFSAIAIYLTSLWDKGFILNFDWKNMLKAVVIIAIIFYLVVPLSKIILLPLNILTLGLISTVFSFLIFYLLIAKYDIITIKPWVFTETNLFGLVLPKTNISFVGNLILSSLSVSTIINLLEKFI